MAASIVLHLEAVKGFLTQIAGTACFGDVVKCQRLHVEQLLSTTELSVVDAERVATAVKGIPWPAEVSDALMQLVGSKMAQKYVTTGRRKNQDFTKWMMYFETLPGVSLLSDQVDSVMKLSIIVVQAVKLGLRNPTELTYQAIAALLMACNEGFSKAMATTAAIKFPDFAALQASVQERDAESFGVLLGFCVA